MAITATIERFFRVSEPEALSLQHIADPSLVHNLGLAKLTLTPTSTPAISKAWSKRVALSSGSLTLDLTALSRGSALDAVDLTGLKVQAALFSAPSTNTDTVLIEEGATNGYAVFGDATGEIRLAAGGSCCFYNPEGNEDVGASALAIDFTSSDVDANVDILLVAG